MCTLQQKITILDSNGGEHTQETAVTAALCSLCTQNADPFLILKIYE